MYRLFFSLRFDTEIDNSRISWAQKVEISLTSEFWSSVFLKRVVNPKNILSWFYTARWIYDVNSIWLGWEENERTLHNTWGELSKDNLRTLSKTIILEHCQILYLSWVKRLCKSIFGLSFHWSVCLLVWLSVCLSHLSIIAFFASLLLPKCLSGLLHHCPHPPARD